MKSANKQRRSFVLGAVAAACLSASYIATAATAVQEYPSRMVKFVVPFTPGSGTDISARAVAKKLEEITGQTVIVDNRPGGNNIIGVQTVVKSPADGYTLFFGTNSPMAGNVAVYKKLPYDPVKDFAPVSLLSRQDWVITVSGRSPYKSVQELVAAANNTPGSVTAGAGATGYNLAALTLAKNAGFQVTVVPYKGTPQAMQDVIGGHVTYTVTDIASAKPYIDSGALRPLAVLTEKRSPMVPNVPSLKEAGLESINLFSWAGVFAPAGTPQAVIDKLSALVGTALADAEVRKYYASIGADVLAGGPADLRDFQQKDIDNYRWLMQRTGFKPIALQ